MKKQALTILLALTAFVACSTAFTRLVEAGPGTPLATLNNQPITEDEVMAKANKRMMKLLSEMYDVKKQVIEEIVDDRLLEAEAKKQGTTADTLVKKAADGAASPSDAEAKTIYEMQKSRAFKDKTFEEVKNDIKKQLTNQKQHMAVNTYLDGLRKGADVKLNIERPSINVSVDDDPSQGSTTAPVTLIEFSEFQCPFCKRTRPTLKKVMETYAGKIRYVFRDFPLSFHKEARGAALSANCAHEQKKYWEFNEKLFENQDKLGKALYDQTAKDLGLDIAAFDKCVTANKTDEIDKDQSDGMDVGVTGTPAYFINGKFLSGAQPFAAFQEIIDEELAKKK
jgi:protein-disulfide isomerase